MSDALTALADEPAVDAGDSGGLSGAPVSRTGLGLLLTIGGALGLLASFVLTVERFKLAADPSYRPSCSINPLVSCGSVMASRQAELFGFPNPILGLPAFAVTITIGVLVLSGVAIPWGIRIGLQAGVTLGLVFVAWLVAAALFSIHALCPYCMVVWAVVIPTFWTVTADTLDSELIPLPARARRLAGVLVEYRTVAIVASYALVVALVGYAFWGSWGVLFS